MNFKEWYESIERGDDNAPYPYIIVKGENHYKQVISNLERLGFFAGNDFSKYGVPVTYVDIWYSDFWNSHISELESKEYYFEFTLDDLLGLNRKGELV